MASEVLGTFLGHGSFMITKTNEVERSRYFVSPSNTERLIQKEKELF